MQIDPTPQDLSGDKGSSIHRANIASPGRFYPFRPPFRRVFGFWQNDRMVDMKKPKPIKWHAFDEAQAKAVADAQRPDVIYFPSTADCAPTGMLGMPGVFLWAGSNLSTPVMSSNGLTIGAELVVQRTDGTVTDGYAFMAATSSDGVAYFAGPYKNFPAHQVHPGQSVPPLTDFFGHTPAARAGIVPGGTTMTMTPSPLSTYPAFGTNYPSQSMLMTTATSCTSSTTSSRSS